jgi:tetratricopeptide (TPR) repeat protein
MTIKSAPTILALVAVLAAALPPGITAAQGEPIDKISDVPRRARLALFQAYEARGRGDYQSSTEILQNFLEHNPGDDHFLLRFHLGNSMAQTNTPEEQLEQYQKCVELEPRFAKGWMSLGEVAYNLGRYELAGQALSNAFRLSEQKKPESLYYAAAAYLMAERPAEAVPLLEQLVSGEWGAPKLDWYRALVSAALQTEDRDTGAHAVSSMLERFESDPEAWTLAFQYAAGSGDYRQAAVALTIKGYLTPLSREEQIQLADLNAAIDVPARAAGYYEEALQEEASTGELERLASSYLAAHDSEEALRTLNRALQQEPTPRLWSLYGDLNFMERNYQEAYQAYRNSAAMDAEDGRAHLMMAYCAMEAGDREGAVKHLNIAAGFPAQETKAREVLDKIDDYMQSPAGGDDPDGKTAGQ